MPEEDANQFPNDVLENIKSLVGLLDEPTPKAEERDLVL
jgi:hypothetical protein